MTLYLIFHSSLRGTDKEIEWPVKPKNWGEADMQEKEEYEYLLSEALSQTFILEDQERAYWALRKIIIPKTYSSDPAEMIKSIKEQIRPDTLYKVEAEVESVWQYREDKGWVDFKAVPKMIIGNPEKYRQVLRFTTPEN